MDSVPMAMEAINAPIFARIANVSHNIAVTAQAIVLNDPLAEISGPNLGWNGVGNDAKDIPASGIYDIHAAGNQTVRIMTVSAIGFAGMGRVQICIYLIFHGMTPAAKLRLCQTQGRYLDQQHPKKPQDRQ